MTTAFKYTLALTLLIAVALILFPEVTAPLEVGFYLALGWLPFLYHTLPQVHLNWPAIATTLFATAALLFFGHTFARRLRREVSARSRVDVQSSVLDVRGSPWIQGEPPSTPLHASWPLRWTVALAATVLLLFTAGLAATGLTHHAARLLTADDPLFRSAWADRAPRVRCMYNLRQIGQALILHASDHHGRFPARLEDLMITEDVPAYIFNCAVPKSESFRDATTREVADRLREGHGAYVFLTPNLEYPPPKPIPVVTEPLANHDTTGLNILFSDGSVEWHTPEEAQKILTPREPGKSQPP